MSKRILHVVNCSHRATLEEQDDPIVWLSRSMRGAGAAVDVLLAGNAVTYTVRQQDASGLSFGERRQSQSAHVADDLSSLIEAGAGVFYAAADARERGVDRADMIGGPAPVEPAGVAELFSRYDLVLNW